MQHVQKLATVITVRVQTFWESLLQMVFAHSISVHQQNVCVTFTFPLHIQTCRATRESMAKRPPGKTGSGPLVVTCPMMKIGLVNGRTTRPVFRRKKMRSAKFNLGAAVIDRVASFLYSRCRKAHSHPRVTRPAKSESEVPSSASQFGSFPQTQPISTSIARNVVPDGFHSAGLGG